MRFFGLASALVLAGALAAPAHARAQDPSADAILKSLTPGTGSSTTRGIRVVQPAAPAPATPGHPQHRRTSAPVETGEAAPAPSVNLTVDFETGSAELRPDAVHTLDHLGEALSNATLAKDRFRIVGHTDTVGDASANKALSERRAAAVVDYLVQYYHVDRARLIAEGVGEAGLLVQTGQGVAEPRNRRVEVINLG